MSSSVASRFVLATLGVGCVAAACAVHAQSVPAARLELRFEPVERAQLALWVERADGEFLATVRLTEAVSLRGIGNRPGASQMNSGFHWPYGRREGVLPIWATRRASAPGAKHFRRVIFQNRTSEGAASRTAPALESTPDDYFCLSFDNARSSKDALDAVSCATQFSSDKGRYLTEADVEAGYAEPYEVPRVGRAVQRPLGLDSLYPPRRDAKPCQSQCIDHADAVTFPAHALEVMPELDAVTMATPQGDMPQNILFKIPADWSAGEYRACLEINVEGDYNATFDDHSYPTPAANATCDPRDGWDYYALCFGYPYRGQPSVVYCADFDLGDDAERRFTVFAPEGAAGTWDVMAADFGTLQSMEGMTDDPAGAPGSGADRLRQLEDGSRLQVVVRPGAACMGDASPSAVTQLATARHPSELHAHEWTKLSFGAASDDQAVFRYDVRVSTQPITDDASFMKATPAKQATPDAPELLVPTDAAPGERVEVALGGLNELTHYYIAVRAMDGCAAVGPIRTVELTTPKRIFATVSPCMVATAAWGTPLAHEVGVLRRLRDRQLQTHALGRALVSTYYAIGSRVADAIRERPALRALARSLLTPVIALARVLD